MRRAGGGGGISILTVLVEPTVDSASLIIPTDRRPTTASVHTCCNIVGVLVWHGGMGHDRNGGVGMGVRVNDKKAHCINVCIETLAYVYV